MPRLFYQCRLLVLVRYQGISACSMGVLFLVPHPPSTSTTWYYPCSVRTSFRWSPWVALAATVITHKIRYTDLPVQS